ncbi:ABC transporter permease [Actinomadura sp. LOL_016]|uniref:ABC transporter permease n=1 Tax=unclassified Actinomadura TaxID=2626254 RepID=UPI003A81107D
MSPGAAGGRGSAAARALSAEWTKLRTLRSTGWLLFALAASTAAAGAATLWSVDTAHCPTPDACFEDTPRLSLSGVRVGQVAAVVLGVLAIGGEYGTRTIVPTLAAVPRRGLVLAAKAAVVAVLVAAAGAAGVAGSLAAGRFVLPRNGFTAAAGYPPLSVLDGPTARAAAGSVLYLVLVALLGLGAAAAVRGTAGGLTGVLGLLWAAPVVVPLLGDDRWQERLEPFAPMPAGLAVQVTRAPEPPPVGPWEGLGVLAAWAALALLLGGAVLARRDA